MAATHAGRLVAAARALDAQARQHKRLSASHREAARRCRARQAEIEGECRRLGIGVTYTDSTREGSAAAPSGAPADKESIHGGRQDRRDPRG